MTLRLESRPVGDVLVVQCYGRIVAGDGAHALHAYFGDTRSRYIEVVLQMDQVEFIDSSGLGALVLRTQAIRAKHGDLKLMGVPEMIRRMLKMTNLASLFEVYDSLDEAVTAAYLGSRYSKGQAGDPRPRVLGLIDSTDVRSLLREVLHSAGYNTVMTSKMEDAEMLAKAMKPNTVLLSARMSSMDRSLAQESLQRLVPGARFVMLDEGFATQDPGEAAQKLLSTLAGL